MDANRHESEVVRIALLAGDDGVVEGHRFERCQINGPAILAPQGTTEFHGNTFNAPNTDAVLWEIDPAERPEVIGPVVVKDCSFVGCTFTRVGVTGPKELLDHFR